MMRRQRQKRVERCGGLHGVIVAQPQPERLAGRGPAGDFVHEGFCAGW
jgi:hypothetical protein